MIRPAATTSRKPRLLMSFRRPAHHQIACTAALLVLLLASCADAGSHAPEPPSSAAGAETLLPVVESRFRSVTLDARQPPDDATLDRLQQLGVTHVTLITFGFQPAFDVPEIRMHTDGGWYSESDHGIRTLARQATARSMRVIIKPHVWVGRYSADGQQRHSIAFATETEWQQWETQYHAFLLHYARLAEEIDAPLLVIGTELAGSTRQRPQFWRRLIADVREVYRGELTYAANWFDDYEAVPFWDALDYIGVQAYFELTDQPNPDLEVLRSSWDRHVENLAGLARDTGRPVLFTEIGYRAVPDAASQPWRWPSRSVDHDVAPNYALQSRLFQAFFECLWHQPWFAGAIIWKFYPYEATSTNEHALDFTPQNKPAEAVIRQWFRADGTASR